MQIKDSILLTIAVPTYNRYKYLKEIVPELIKQCDQVDPLFVQIEMIFSDNASTDETPNYLQSINNRRVKYYRNNKNIGGDANFIECVKKASGKYVWLFGDDDLIIENGVGIIFEKLKEYEPALITHSNFPTSKFFQTYRDALKYSFWRDPIFSYTIGFITSTVFLRELFDFEKAVVYLPTNICHVYAIMENLRGNQKGIYVFGKNNKIIFVRKEQAKMDVPLQNFELKIKNYVYYVSELYKIKRIFYIIWLYINYSTFYNQLKEIEFHVRKSILKR